MMSGSAPELMVEGHIATIMLCRPDAGNRLEPEDIDTICRHVDEVSALPEVMVLRIASTGRQFCTGFNVGRLGEGAGAIFSALPDAIERARPITIAAIQGNLYGGATDLALACDFRVGVVGCELSVPAARLGLHFYRSGLQRYVSRLGLGMAKRVLLACRTIDTPALVACGFLDQLCDSAAALQAEVDALSHELAGMAPLALLNMKKHLNRIARGDLDVDELAVDIARAEASDDLVEGIAARREKRSPRFTGK